MPRRGPEAGNPPKISEFFGMNNEFQLILRKRNSIKAHSTSRNKWLENSQFQEYQSAYAGNGIPHRRFDESFPANGRLHDDMGTFRDHPDNRGILPVLVTVKRSEDCIDR